MSRHEFQNLSRASRVMADQATRKDIWETAACEDLSEWAGAADEVSGPDLVDRFNHWIEVGATYFDGPPPLSGVIQHLRWLPKPASNPGAVKTLISLYDEVVAVGAQIFETDAFEGHLVALMDQDRYALDRLRAKVFVEWRTNLSEPLTEAYSRILTEACEGLPRLCSPGR